jgi:hypothetical protein
MHTIKRIAPHDRIQLRYSHCVNSKELSFGPLAKHVYTGMINKGTEYRDVPMIVCRDIRGFHPKHDAIFLMA